MKKLTTVALALAAMGVANQASAFTTTANVTFTWGNNGTNKGWTSQGAPNVLTAMSNTTQFNTLGGNNATGYYNSDFASQSWAQSTCANFQSYRQYGCRDLTAGFFASPIADANNVSASGTLTVTPTTLTGTLTLNATSDECVGAPGGANPGCGTSGWNVRSADGSPFGNVWYGYGAGGASGGGQTPEGTTTLTVNLTGTFTNVAGSWTIDGGTVRVQDSNNISCQQGGSSTPPNLLCFSSTVIGGYSADGSSLSWGVDLDGGGAGTAMGQITVKDVNGTGVIASLAGVLASLSVDGSGNITTSYGETRSALGSTACTGDHIRWDAANNRISCGTLTVQGLNVAGTVAVIPVPAGVWLLGSAIGALALRRRKLAA